MESQNWYNIYKYGLYTFFVFLFCWIGYHTYQFIETSHGFILGDWLVNYHDGGFKRRGLTGSLFFMIQDVTGLRLKTIVFIGQMVLYFLFFVLFVRILQKKKVTLLFVSLIFSPLTLLFFINDIHIVGRKEIILFVIFAFFVHLLSKDQFKGFKEYLIYALLFIGVLFHEIFIFYAPYFVLTLWLFNKKVDYWKGARLYLSVFIPTCIVFFFGKAINEGESLNILKQRGIEFGSGQLSIFDFSNDLLSSIDRYLETPWGYALYSVSLILGLLHVYYYLRKEHSSESKRILWSFLLLIGYSLPLFILVCDWGRWIQIHFILLLLVLATLLPTKTKESVVKKTSLPVWKYSLAVTYIILLLTWRVYHFKNGFVLDGFLTYLFNKIV